MPIGLLTWQTTTSTSGLIEEHIRINEAYSVNPEYWGNKGVAYGRECLMTLSPWGYSKSIQQIFGELPA